MSYCRTIFTVVCIFWVSEALSAPPIAVVSVTLPSNQEWQKITDNSAGGAYIREWIPAGSAVETTDWLIVEQKLYLEERSNSKTFIKGIMELAQSACTDVLFNGPEKIKDAGHTTYWARIMCAQQVGKSYGTFTDQRVAVDKNWVYVVTSEIRTNPTAVAGQLSFEPGEEKEIAEFLARVKASSSLVRTGVQVETE